MKRSLAKIPGAPRPWMWVTAAGLAAGLAAIWRYPGGTARDHAIPGYTFTQNYLSDLGMTVGYGGQANRAGAALFVVSLSLLVFGLGAALVQLARGYSSDARSRGYARGAIIAAAAACACFLGVAVTPENRVMGLHVGFTHGAFDLLPVAALAMTFAALEIEDRSGAAAWTFLTTALAIYAWIINWGPTGRVPGGHTFQVISQKAIAVVLIVELSYLGARKAIAPATIE